MPSVPNLGILTTSPRVMGARGVLTSATMVRCVEHVNDHTGQFRVNLPCMEGMEDNDATK